MVVGPQGKVLVRGPLFDEALITADLRTDEITRARAGLPLLADLEAQLLNLLEPPSGAGDRELAFDPEDECHPSRQQPTVW
jgi:hypothetical protein